MEVMRRKDKEITDIALIEDILNKAQVCRIAMCKHNTPYIVPMNFGYKEGILYFHSAKEGKKIDLLKENPIASFEVETDLELVKNEKACNWGMKYFSVIGSGEVVFIESTTGKVQALDVIMEKYAGEKKFEFPESALSGIEVFQIKIVHMTGKKSGY